MKIKTHENEIPFCRERYQVFEKRKFYMLMTSVSGFSIILGFATTLNGIILSLLLFSWVLLTNSIYYNQIKDQVFINSYLIKITRNLGIKTLEEAYSTNSVKDGIESFNIRSIGSNPYIILSSVSFIISIYFVFKENLFEIYYLDLIFKLAIIIILLLLYMCIIIRSYRERNIQITNYNEKLEKYFTKTQGITR